MILDDLSAYARVRVAEDQKKISAGEMRELAYALPKGSFRFQKALQNPGLSFICEVKKASPSKGVIDPVFRYLDIAKAYEQGSADAISCLTEPKWFLGSDDIFREIRTSVATPMIRKDFTVDAYQIHQAACMGADAVLLICSILSYKELEAYLQEATDLGLTALVETHDAKEIEMAVSVGASVIGVNNRNLKNFTVDFSNARRLRDKIPADKLFVAESGLSSPEDARAIADMGADAALVGEYLMRAEDPAQRLAQLRLAVGR